ncbi:MAG: glycosyltransferase [Planctomycetaceae bacterium]|nr:glycosyltransferase [Planctomycetaceae bacterium]|tara:strand:- start:2166 stop:3146 length:981 start_codon:yes stop_codon:yes gene_type:complete
MNFISAVIPVFNESESLYELHREITSVCSNNNYQYEIIFVDDGSTDGSWDVISRLTTDDPNLKGIQFRRNFGKAAALNAGFKEARGDVVFTLDADLQDDPNEIPAFLELLESQELDVISGWKKRRYDPWHKVGPSRVFNKMVSSLTKVNLHDHNCGFKCYRREVLQEVHLYGELHRFVPVLAAARGFKVGELVVNHRKRQFGYSKYGVRRIVKGFLDLITVYMLTGYGHRPQHLLGTLGLTCFGGSACLTLSLVITWIIDRIGEHPPTFHLHERAVFYFALFGVIIGIQLLTAGFLAELVTQQTSRDEQIYAVKDTIGLNTELNAD